MAAKIILNEERLFPAEKKARAIAGALYQDISDLPIISPHGHTDPAWYSKNISFPDAARLFIVPDHYVFRMLHSRGIPLERLGVTAAGKEDATPAPREVWRIFSENYGLFRGTPSRMWFEHVLVHVFGIHERPGPDNSDQVYDAIQAKLDTPEFRIRNLFDSFNIEALATTDSPLDDLAHHGAIQESEWNGRVIPTFRPDEVVDPEFPGFRDNLDRLGDLTGENTGTWQGYLKAMANRREYFISMGATATDHGHPTSATADMDPVQCEDLYRKIRQGNCSREEAEQFRAQMLTEMARMSLDDGLVMQVHPGAFRNHSRDLYARFGRDKGADIPMRTDFVRDLKPLLDRFGHEKNLSVILFTLDESTYSRELAPLAGIYPVLKLGPAWWFHDSPEGMMRFRRMTTETAGFYNTVGFNDDTRAFLSIPARHDVARRVDCAFLAELVATHRLDEDEAVEVARDLACNLAREAYKL